MKKNVFAAVFLSVLVITPLAASDFGADGASRNTELNVEDMLRYAIEDEYLALAEYQRIMERHGEIRPFTNIMRAEETHIALLEPLFAARNLPLPANTAADHVVVPDELKTALEIGVQAEIDNIAMYERFLAQDLPQEVGDVFERLEAASKNHLRAFQNNLRRYR